MSIDKNAHLAEVLKTHKMSHVQDFANRVKSKADEIKEKLSNHYGTEKYTSYNSGSMAKHTATNIKFDMDFVEPFKHSAFDTLQNMFDDVFNFLHKEYKEDNDLAEEVRKQKVSIGIKFYQEEGDDKPIEIDVTPGRELSDDDYLNTHDLNLCFNKDAWGFQKGTTRKTNIKKQIDYISGKSEERKIIRLLKIWKKHNAKKYKSFMLELISIDALKDYTGENALWDKLKFTMEYIKDHVNEDSHHLYDPGNSNNDVVGSMDKMTRLNLKIDMETMLLNIERNDEYLKIYFPVNEQFKEEEKEDSFGNKSGREGYSTPSTSRRFG